MNVVSARGFV